MATAARPPPEIIDLVSDSEDEPPSTPTPAPRRPVHRSETPDEMPNSPPPQQDVDGVAPLDDMFFENVFYERRMPGAFDNPGLLADDGIPDVPLVIDDFGYLDEDAEDQLDGLSDQQDDDFETVGVEKGARTQPAFGDVLTEDDCLARIYEMFPDVCPDHVASLYAEVGNADLGLPIAVYLDRIIEKMLSESSYPKKRRESQQLKRKREESIDENHVHWENENREELPRFLTTTIRTMLKAEFPTFTHAFITETLTKEKYLYKAYIRLADIKDTEGPFRQRGRASLQHTDADLIATNSGWPPLAEELAAARRKVHANQEQRANDARQKQIEDENLQRAITAGNTAECQACFDDLPMNRQIHCHGEEAHFTCYSCMETYIKSEIGESRCRVLCTAGCGAGFAPAQLNQLSDKKLLEKLADLQQEKDIRDAALENLEECPFCEYKAILPPIEEDFEFRCANPECEKVSCRRCKASSHIPISCEQYAKDNKVNSRHKIEEAMTAALIRSCNRCKKQFIKEYGCNKMTCPSCQNVQCYVCSETLKGYEHFDQHPGGVARAGGIKCPLYDNLEQRHEREVKAAEDATKAEIMASNPDVVPEDLEIKMSDAVNNATAQRIRQAGPEGLGGGPLGWLGIFEEEDGLPQVIRGLREARGQEFIARMQNRNLRREERLEQIRNLADANRDDPMIFAGRRRREALRGAQQLRGAAANNQAGGNPAGPPNGRPHVRLRVYHALGNNMPNANAAEAQHWHFVPPVLPNDRLHDPWRADAPREPQTQPGPLDPVGFHRAIRHALPQNPQNQPDPLDPVGFHRAMRRGPPQYPMGPAMPPFADNGNFPIPQNQYAQAPPNANQNQRLYAGVQANMQHLEVMRRQHDVRQLMALQQDGYEPDFGPYIDAPGDGR